MQTDRARLLAWTAVVAAPLPLLVALVVTAKPVYSPDACFYGATATDAAWTDRYLGLMVPLACFGLAAAAAVAAWMRWRRHWHLIAAGLLAWAALTLLWQPASHPVMYPYGIVALFGIFLTPPALAVAAVWAKQSSWLKAVAWFETLYLVPVLLGLAKILAQPACMS